MSEIVTKSAKYVFLDVVNFTHNRSVEAQTEIIGVLNSVVLETVSKHNVDAENLILLPTGDGICLVLLGIETPYDIHIQIALSLIEGIEKHNAAAKDEQRKFTIRVGINSNVDNLITDVNGSRNIAGAGINLAQRVMNVADGNQILVGQPVFEILSQREKYMYAFRPYTSMAKHGLRLNVHQLVIDGFQGLDVTTPSQFRIEGPAPPAPEKLREIVAYYMAHAMVHRAEIVSCVNHGQACYSLVVLLRMLAWDSYEAKRVTTLESLRSHHARPVNASFLERFNYYETQDFWLCCELSGHVQGSMLDDTQDLFEQPAGDPSFRVHFVSPEGQRKLKADWPDIWGQFNLEAHSNLES